MWDPTAETASIWYYVLDWGEGKMNIPDSRDDVQLTSPHTNSSGGRQVSVSIALVEVAHIAPAIHKHASLCTLLSFFLALAIWHPGHQTKDAKVMDGLLIETQSQSTT